MQWSKRLAIIAALLTIVVVGNIFVSKFFNENTSPNSEYQNLTNKIDSLNVEIYLLKLQRDSLFNIIDSSKVKVEIITNWYEKELVDITNQSIASDVVFFSNYISEVNK